MEHVPVQWPETGQGRCLPWEGWGAGLGADLALLWPLWSQAPAGLQCTARTNGLLAFVFPTVKGVLAHAREFGRQKNRTGQHSCDPAHPEQQAHGEFAAFPQCFSVLAVSQTPFEGL